MSLLFLAWHWFLHACMSVSLRACVYVFSTPASPSSSTSPASPTHFLHIDDFDKATILQLLKRAEEVKAIVKAKDESFKPFKVSTSGCRWTAGKQDEVGRQA